MTVADTLRQVFRDAGSLIRQWDGPLTRDLLLQPGKFGLGMVPAAAPPTQVTDMVCGYCSTGCGLTMHLRDGEAVRLSPATNYPVNLGMACPKGWEALEVLDAPDRAVVPLLRNPAGKLQAVGWNEALEVFVRRFKEVQAKHGPESTAFISTGQIVTEEMAFLGALAKFGMGMIHGDGNTRQCMATAVVAYKEAFGFDAPPYTYADFESSDVLVFVGANPCIAHPIMWERVMRNPHKPAIIVLDPRRTETAMYAREHLALQPKSDLALLYGLANLLIEGGYVKEEFIAAHTHGFAEFREFVREFTPPKTADLSGLTIDQLRRTAELIGRGERVSFWWTMGINQSHEGVRAAQAIINIALMTGNIGRPGTGANSITGQCNAMGSRLFSNTTNLLGGHDFKNPAHRAKIAGKLNIPVTNIPDRDSWAYNEILEGILKGKIKGLWILATNTAHSWINQGHCRDVLDRLDFLVVQDMYHSTETVRHADLLLPAAGWGEKEGTFINSERRIGLVKRVRRAPGQALSDFAIFRLVAEAWGCGRMFRDWTSPEAVFGIIKELSKGQPCDFSGIRDYAAVDAAGGIQWPFPAENPDEAQERRLFADGKFFHTDGKAKFVFEAPREMPEAPSRQFPLLLLTGRGSASQWHTQTRTGKSDVLRKLVPQDVYAEIHPTDARQYGIEPHGRIVVESPRGSLIARAFVTPTVKPGQIFIPMHYEETNRLTHSSFDPYSKQPNYKACAVSIRAEHAVPS